MSDSIISVENLSKRYHIGRQSDRGDGLRHILEQAVRAPFRLLSGNGREKQGKTEEFWAVNDISLEIKRGDRKSVV